MLEHDAPVTTMLELTGGTQVRSRRSLTTLHGATLRL